MGKGCVVFDRYRAKRARNKAHRMLRHSWQDMNKRNIKDAIRDYNKILHSYLEFCSNPKSALAEKYGLYAEIRELYVSLVDLSKKRLMIPPELSRKKEGEGKIQKEEGMRNREGMRKKESAAVMPAAEAASTAGKPAKKLGKGAKKPKSGSKKKKTAKKLAPQAIPKKKLLPEKTRKEISEEKKKETKETKEKEEKKEKKEEAGAAEKGEKKPSPAKQRQKYATVFDEFYAGIDPEKGTFLFAMAKKFGISNDKAEHWAKILENNNMITIDNPVFGGPLLRIRKEGGKEENSDNGDNGNNGKVKGARKKRNALEEIWQGRSSPGASLRSLFRSFPRASFRSSLFSRFQ